MNDRRHAAGSVFQWQNFAKIRLWLDVSFCSRVMWRYADCDKPIYKMKVSWVNLDTIYDKKFILHSIFVPFFLLLIFYPSPFYLLLQSLHVFEYPFISFSSSLVSTFILSSSFISLSFLFYSAISPCLWTFFHLLLFFVSLCLHPLQKSEFYLCTT